MSICSKQYKRKQGEGLTSGVKAGGLPCPLGSLGWQFFLTLILLKQVFTL